jgi:hypothetical protein
MSLFTAQRQLHPKSADVNRLDFRSTTFQLLNMLSLAPNLELADCRKLFLRNYQTDINIGVYDFEKGGEQRVVVNVELYVPLAQS